MIFSYIGYFFVKSVPFLNIIFLPIYKVFTQRRQWSPIWADKCTTHISLSSVIWDRPSSVVSSAGLYDFSDTEATGICFFWMLGISLSRMLFFLFQIFLTVWLLCFYLKECVWNKVWMSWIRWWFACKLKLWYINSVQKNVKQLLCFLECTAAAKI